MDPTVTLRQIVIDCPDVRASAEFYRQLLDYHYPPGEDPSAVRQEGLDWLVLLDSSGNRRIAFQQVGQLPEADWPEGPHPQMMHLDLSVSSVEALEAANVRALGLGARVLEDRSDDPQEALRVYADPAGHPFCIFMAGQG